MPRSGAGPVAGWGGGGGGAVLDGWEAYDATTLTPKAPYQDVRVRNLTVTGTAVISSTTSSTGQFLSANGTAGAPAYSSTNDPNSGIFWNADDTMRFSLGGTERFRGTTTGMDFGALALFFGSAIGTSTVGLKCVSGTILGVTDGSTGFGTIQARVGTDANPSYAGNGTSSDTGMNIFNTDTIDWICNGTRYMRLNFDGSFQLVGYMGWGASISGGTDLRLSRVAADHLRQGASANNDADGTTQILSTPAGGTVSAGTTGRIGAFYAIRTGAGSAAKAASGANGGAGGDIQLEPGAGGAGDGGGSAGANGVVDFRNAVDGAAAQTATLTNGPTAGNPAIWLKVKIAGNVRYIPAWA